jgi:hypothetical protein
LRGRAQEQLLTSVQQVDELLDHGGSA